MMSGGGSSGSDLPKGEGYRKAIELVSRCATKDGFLASPSQRQNYRRIWARDGVIIGLASLMTGDPRLIETFRLTLLTLADHQGPHGEIPSNVDRTIGRTSYGGTTGRVDADLWFLVGCTEYWKATGNDSFLAAIWDAMMRAHGLLGSWEFNNRGLIYVPQTGDWADEYIHAGYVLYDQLLYLQAKRGLLACCSYRGDKGAGDLARQIVDLKEMIRANFWFDENAAGEGIYHEILYEKGRKAAPARACYYWMPFFQPTGYGYRFDALANVLCSLLDVADDRQREHVDDYVETIVPPALRLLPAFHPVIKPIDDDWEELLMNFSYTFKNKPYEFQNGGLWPFITGFHIADLARRGQTDKARGFLEALHEANAMEMDGKAWGFPEFVHGRDLVPGGTRNQGWSAAGAVIAEHALAGGRLFRINEND